jgi:hypothetical protein
MPRAGERAGRHKMLITATNVLTAAALAAEHRLRAGCYYRRQLRVSPQYLRDLFSRSKNARSSIITAYGRQSSVQVRCEKASFQTLTFTQCVYELPIFIKYAHIPISLVKLGASNNYHADITFTNTKAPWLTAIFHTTGYVRFSARRGRGVALIKKFGKKIDFGRSRGYASRKLCPKLTCKTAVSAMPASAP